MGIRDDIQKEVRDIFRQTWQVRNGTTIPDETSIGLDNSGSRIEATVLYADMADSTEMVKLLRDEVAAEIYKAFLKTTCRIIKENDGEITAFDGDRVMAVYLGTSQSTNAARTALRINYAIKNIVQIEFKNFYTSSNHEIEFGIGIDRSNILVAKTGIRGSNDLVWVGNAANMAAKLCSLRSGYQRIWITEEVFERLHESMKYGGDPKTLMWSPVKSTEFGITIYSTSYWQEMT